MSRRAISSAWIAKASRGCVRKLEINRQMLAHHLRAMDEISALVSRAMQEAESDGTYGRCGV